MNLRNPVLRLEPNNFTANLALAVLLLRRSDDVSTLSKVWEPFDKARQGFTKACPDQQMDYTLNAGIYLALTGDLDEARNQLESLLFGPFRGHVKESAKEALKAIGKS